MGNTFDKYLHKLKILQKKAVRIVCHAAYNSPTATLFKKLHILKLDDIYNLHIGQFMYKLRMEMLPISLQNIIPRNCESHSHDTRHKDDFVIPNYKSNTVFRSHLCTGPRLWSKIPIAYKLLNYKPFRNKLKKQFLDLY